MLATISIINIIFIIFIKYTQNYQSECAVYC